MLPHDLPLTELHVHIGGAVDPAVMWSLAHSQGIRLPTKDYWEFCDLITAVPGRVKTFEQYLSLFHWTELIQSSPSAIERSLYETIGSAYRRNRITTLELRFNPMKRNRSGERDLDHIIAAAARGVERAMLEYPVRAGLILCLDKAFSYELNEIIVRKAIAHRARGIVGIDIAGPEDPSFRFAAYARLFRQARDAGLGVTVHAGESGTVAALREAVLTLEPDRIGHGIRSVEEPELLDILRGRRVTLEICPTSNLRTGVVRDRVHLGEILATFLQAGVRFCFNTDGPEMLGTSLRAELEWLVDHRLVDEPTLWQTLVWAKEASFIALERSDVSSATPECASR